MPGQMILKIWDVQHGAGAMLTHRSVLGIDGRLAMIDSGHKQDTGWKPSTYIRHYLKRSALHYLFVTNARRDGWIQFAVDDFGNFDIYTEKCG